MGLLDVRDYLQQRGSCTLKDIATHFNTQPAAVQFVVGEWERRGKVRNMMGTCSTGGTCGGSCCKSVPDPVYQWVG